MISDKHVIVALAFPFCLCFLSRVWVGIIACDAVIVIRLHTDPRSFSALEHKACVHLLENTNDLVFSLTLNDICISQLDELSGASSC